MSDWLFTEKSQLEALFTELASELARRDLSVEIVIVGGGWMLWHELRFGTRDVDSVTRLEHEVTAAIAAVAKTNEVELETTWLNDNAAPFWPLGESFADTTTVFESDAFVVRVPSARVIFLMKLYRGLPPDVEDMIKLWPLTEFANADAAAAAFFEAYPHAPPDPHMANFIDQNIANRG